jgi:hypothetical protein
MYWLLEIPALKAIWVKRCRPIDCRFGTGEQYHLMARGCLIEIACLGCVLLQDRFEWLAVSPSIITETQWLARFLRPNRSNGRARWTMLWEQCAVAVIWSRLFKAPILGTCNVTDHSFGQIHRECRHVARLGGSQQQILRWVWFLSR